MTYLAAAWAWFTGLSIIAKLGGGVAALGILSPVMSALTFVWTAVKAILTWIFDGFQNVVAHPVTLSIVMLAFLGGLWTQHDLDKRKIESYKIDAQNIAKKVQGAKDVEDAKAKAAIAARDAAKMLPLFEPNVVVTTVAPGKPTAPPIALDTTPDRLRKPAAIRRGSKCDAVFCF